MTRRQVRLLAGFGLWAASLVWAVFFPGGTHAETALLLEHLIGALRGDAVSPNPALLLHFTLMGIWPWVILQFWAGEAPFRGRLLPKLAAFLLANVAGAFAVLPYESLRSSEPTRLPPRWFNRFGLSRWVPALFFLLTLGLFLNTWRQGGWEGYYRLLISNSFVRIMFLDFLLFHALALRMMVRDSRERKWELHPAQWLLFFVPLAGPLLFLVFRPRLEAAHPFMVRL